MTDLESRLIDELDALKSFVSALHIELQQLQQKLEIEPIHYWPMLYRQIDGEQLNG